MPEPSSRKTLCILRVAPSDFELVLPETVAVHSGERIVVHDNYGDTTFGTVVHRDGRLVARLDARLGRKTRRVRLRRFVRRKRTPEPPRAA